MTCQVQLEIAAQMAMDHCNVVKCWNVEIEDDHIHLILEYCCNGDLFKRVRGASNRHLNEREVFRLFLQIVSGVHHIHSLGFCHRDLKLENLLLDEHHNLKIADFGWVSRINGFRRNFNFCGTLDYLAPEMITGSGHDWRVDIWAIGILLYELSCGKPPFLSTSHYELLNRILNVKIHDDHIIPVTLPTIKPDCLDVIKYLLRSDPRTRIDLPDLLHLPWIHRMLKQEYRAFLQTLPLEPAPKSTTKEAIQASFCKCRTDHIRSDHHPSHHHPSHHHPSHHHPSDHHRFGNNLPPDRPRKSEPPTKSEPPAKSEPPVNSEQPAETTTPSRPRKSVCIPDASRPGTLSKTERSQQERSQVERSQQERSQQERCQQERCQQERSQQERSQQERCQQERCQQHRSHQDHMVPHPVQPRNRAADASQPSNPIPGARGRREQRLHDLEPDNQWLESSHQQDRQEDRQEDCQEDRQQEHPEDRQGDRQEDYLGNDAKLAHSIRSQYPDDTTDDDQGSDGHQGTCENRSEDPSPDAPHHPNGNNPNGNNPNGNNPQRNNRGGNNPSQAARYEPARRPSGFDGLFYGGENGGGGEDRGAARNSTVHRGRREEGQPTQPAVDYHISTEYNVTGDCRACGQAGTQLPEKSLVLQSTAREESQQGSFQEVLQGRSFNEVGTQEEDLVPGVS
ncbi:protein kinase [Gregarina niphandrodes]|uniref:Protein kinase n=1 Tax=Gregarina niphandrodes TaxID=110365 RepID=A0A023B3X5_GRENI|nr:protein kinase [Gregarina niphandrodes]EZG56061.1 protein kinase [Gregarina niphandrodes]|eukprot:XP_011131350.1 protein kinase [Gregarina niphandrodes]